MKRASNKKGSRRNKPAQNTKERILVVEQEEPLRKIFVSILTAAGYECREATGALNGLSYLEAGQEFGLIVTDLVNDGLGGIGLLERTKHGFPDVRVVMMTTMQRMGYAFEAMRNGAYDYIFKPFERDQLMAVVRRALEHRGLTLENRDYRKKVGALTVPAAPKPSHVLVQDDEEAIREIVSSMLTASNYKCRGVASPKEVLDIVKSGEQCELVLCGLLETLEEDFFKRMSEQFPDIPMVVLSAYHSCVSLFMSALRDGAYDYLQKPFEREELLIVVRRALEYRRLKLENRALQLNLAKLA